MRLLNFLVIAALMAQQAPLSKGLSVQNSPATPLTLANGFNCSTQTTQSNYAVNPYYRLGMVQVYNLGNNKDQKNDATIDYQILDLATNKQILDTQESAAKLNPNADQLTLEKSMPLASLQPGKYQVTIKVNDGNLKQQIAQSANFNVEQ